MKVKILEGGCENDLQYWMDNSLGIYAVGCCSISDCEQPAEIGGHVEVTKADSDWDSLKYSKKNSLFIIPICTGCNNKHGQEYEVKQGTVPTERVIEA